MNNKQKLIVKIMIIIAIISIVLAIILVAIKKIEEKKIQASGDLGEEINYEDVILEDVEDKVKYFTVANCITKYYNQIAPENPSYYGRTEEGYGLIVEQDKINQDNYDLLSEEYIEKNNITVENVNDHIDRLQDNILYTPLKMKVLIGERVEKYVVYGFLQNTQNKFIKELYLIVNLDINNKTFSIEPLNEEYKSIEDIKVESNQDEIKIKNNNTYKDAKINNEYVARNYFNTYKKMSLSNPQIAYQYFEEEYRKKRFVDLEGYKNYIEKNSEELSGTKIEKYSVNTYEGYTEFVCKDQYGNIYIFKETSINNFSVALDTYTIETAKFKETYKTSDDPNKVMMNIDKWFKMLNNRDYKTAYEYLDETFRNEKFDGDVRVFEEFMKQAYPKHYEVSYKKFTDEPGNLYSQMVTIKEIGLYNATEENFSIIMKLEDETNFVMSFEININ